MNFRLQSYIETSFVFLIRVLPQFLASGDVVFNRLFKCLFQFGNGISLKGDQVPDPNYFTKKGFIDAAKFNRAAIAFMFQNIFHKSPSSARCSIINSMAYSFKMGLG